MKTLKDLWQSNECRPGLQVRWQDWGHKYRFFTVKSIDEDLDRILGELDNGEKVSYPANSTNWKIYHPGDEEGPQA